MRRADWVAAVCLLGRGEDCVPVGPAEPNLHHTLIKACDPTLAGERLAPGVTILLRQRTPAGFVVQCKRVMATANTDRTMTMTRPMALNSVSPNGHMRACAVIVADRSKHQRWAVVGCRVSYGRRYAARLDILHLLHVLALEPAWTN